MIKVILLAIFFNKYNKENKFIHLIYNLIDVLLYKFENSRYI